MYNDFAPVYDRLMRDCGYDKWVGFYIRTFEMLGVKPRLVLDLACGTGEITARMAKLGYDMTGIDLSPEMLAIASQKCEALFLEQDMCDFELYGTVDAIVCAMDSVNYITDPSALERVFKLARNYLNPGGLFIFDVNTPYKLEHILGGNTYVQDQDGVFCIWENLYYPKREICEFYLNFFVEEKGLYRRYYEEHAERAYSIERLTAMLTGAGLTAEGVYGGTDFESVTPATERVFFIARNRGKHEFIEHN